MTTHNQLVAITGATGFIGTSLRQQLLQQGFRVRALVRKSARANGLASAGVDPVVGDLDNSAALATLVADCDAVIHAAGAVRGNSQADFDRVNVSGTAGLLQAVAAQSAPPRLLLLSSIVAREPGLSWYSHSKRKGEKLLEEQHAVPWTILRPPAVYGPGDKEMLPIFRWMQRGVALVPGSPEARNSLIHVSDLVDAIASCLRSDAAIGQIMPLCDGRENGYSWHELASIASERWSRHVRMATIPHWLLDAVAIANSRIARVTGTAPMLTQSKLRELRHEDWVTENGAITSTTGWTPRVELLQGLQDLTF
ncbi:MAG: NAD(P)H-binding protein [Halioglobus sp.]|nr:NAD(P)H-binding protein [Halioglobus sp.]